MSRGSVGAGEVDIGFWCVNLKERDHLEVLGVDVRIVIILVDVVL
jgi:hypothetical protein